jgi:hypothetical protein
MEHLKQFQHHFAEAGNIILPHPVKTSRNNKLSIINKKKIKNVKDQFKLL